MMDVKYSKEWCFDENRQYGDYGLVQTSYGYHVMYYAGESDRTERQLLADADIRDARYTAYVEELEMLYPLTQFAAGLEKID
jgi:hypothetical protein